MHKSDTEKLLHVKFDEKVTFDDRTSDNCKKAGSNLVRVKPDMKKVKKRIPIKIFSSQSLVIFLQCGCAIVVEIISK